MSRYLREVEKDDYMVDPTTGCWVWTKAVDHGRPKVREDNKTIYMHRRSYEMSKGPIPEGMCVCHTCDNKRCVNPDHLWLGTQLDNMIDKSAKGRWR